MMTDLLFWLYLINAVTLIIHEIDSAYWKEWELFRLPGGVAGFLLLHFPLLIPVLYGLVLVDRGVFAGLILSLLLGLGGLFAFSIHTFFIRQGRQEFKTPVVAVHSLEHTAGLPGATGSDAGHTRECVRLIVTRRLT